LHRGLQAGFNTTGGLKSNRDFDGVPQFNRDFKRALKNSIGISIGKFNRDFNGALAIQ
jgi:hypothetical protein